MSTILELVRLRKEFGGLVAVDDVSLSVECGEIRGLIGPNGSGKTTLFNLITGFLKATRGKVVWQGHDVTGDSPESIASKGLVRTFQHSILFKELTVLENVVMACHLHNRTSIVGEIFGGKGVRGQVKAVCERAMSLLEVMELERLQDEIAGDLPHGHQRALGICMALATSPQLLLLDEPVTGMNPVETNDMVRKIRTLRDQGITVILVEHDMKAIMGCCEYLTVLSFGKKIAEGSPREISNNREVIEAYLGGAAHALS